MKLNTHLPEAAGMLSGISHFQEGQGETVSKSRVRMNVIKGRCEIDCLKQ